MSDVRRFDNLEQTLSQTAKAVEETKNVALSRLASHVHREPFTTESPNTTTRAWQSQITGEANPRYAVDSDGYTRWGPGSSAWDTFLYRLGVGRLACNGSFDVGGDHNVGGNQRVTGLHAGQFSSSSMLFRIDSDPSTTGWRMNWNGSNIQFVRRDTNAAVKTFVIDHPQDPTKYLVHATTESPDNGVEYWGTVKFPADKNSVEVTLPAYFESLTTTENRQVQVTPVMAKEAFQPVGPTNPDPDGPPFPVYPIVQPWECIPQVGSSTISDGKFTIFASRPFPGQEIEVSWLVKAVRKDVPKLETEPSKSLFSKVGNGPYTYLVKKPLGA